MSLLGYKATIGEGDVVIVCRVSLLTSQNAYWDMSSNNNNIM